MVYLLGDGTLPNGIFFKYHLGNNAAKSDFPRFLLPPRTGWSYHCHHLPTRTAPIAFAIGAVAQIAITNPERRLEIINWFCQLLNSYYDRFERGEDNNIAIIDYITNTLMNIRAIETLPILEKIYKRFKIPNTLTRRGIKEIFILNFLEVCSSM